MELKTGTFKSTVLGSPAYAVFATSGVILAAVYLLWAYQRLMFGKVREGGLYGGHTLSDINRKEIVSLALLVVFIVWIGVYPGITPEMAQYVIDAFDSWLKKA